MTIAIFATITEIGGWSRTQPSASENEMTIAIFATITEIGSLPRTQPSASENEMTIAIFATITEIGGLPRTHPECFIKWNDYCDIRNNYRNRRFTQNSSGVLHKMKWLLMKLLHNIF